MKKILCILVLMCSLISLVGCYMYMPHYKDPVVGTYLSKKMVSETSEFTSCRMEIQKITKAQYEQEEGINVCKPNSNIPSYFRFEIYLFSTITNQEELVSSSNIRYMPNTFYGTVNLKVPDKEYSGYFDLHYQNRNTSVYIFDYNIDFYLYRSDLIEGELTPLNKAFQNGLITHQDLQQIAYQYNQKNYKGEIDFDDDGFNPTPQPTSMDDLTNESIRYAWCKEPNSIDSKTESINEFDFYCNYHDYYAVSYSESDDVLVEKYTIDDVTFYNYTEVFVWHQNKK